MLLLPVGFNMVIKNGQKAESCMQWQMLHGYKDFSFAVVTEMIWWSHAQSPFQTNYILKSLGIL